MSMGARPVAVMDPLRFGAPGAPRHPAGRAGDRRGRRRLRQLPRACRTSAARSSSTTATRATRSSTRLCVGVLRHEDIQLANATGSRQQGRPVRRADRRRRHRRRHPCWPSETFAEGGPTKRPAVQVGDPFAEKVLIECCLELFAAHVVEASRTSAAPDCPARPASSPPPATAACRSSSTWCRCATRPCSREEILMSESQERMMAVVEPEHLDRLPRGHRPVGRRGHRHRRGHRQRPARHHLARRDHRRRAAAHRRARRPGLRPAARPAVVPGCAAGQRTPALWPAVGRRSPARDPAAAARLAQPVPTGPGSPTSTTATSWATPRCRMPDDAGVVRVDEETGRRRRARPPTATAASPSSTPTRARSSRWPRPTATCATTGAAPLAVTDCLNFGSPEDPEVMWQFPRRCAGWPTAAASWASRSPAAT